MTRKPTLTLSEAAVAAQVLSLPVRGWILLELADGPRDGTALRATVGGTAPTLSNLVAGLRRVGLIETVRSGQCHVHSLTPAGRAMCDVIRKFSA